VIATYRLIGALASLLFVVPVVQAQSFQGLGTLLSGDDALSEATGVSADGSVVVGWSIGPGGGSRRTQTTGFRWSNGQMSPISAHAYPEYPYGTLAHGISADGTVIVGWSSGGFVNQARAATRWSGSGGSASDIGPQITSEAFAASADGSVIVGSYASQTLRWVRGGSPQLITLGNQSHAYDVSDDGAVIVGYAYAPGMTAYRWEGGTVEYLPTGSPATARSSSVGPGAAPGGGWCAG
jgi:probable HAF family extracellular repeat protein